MADAVEVLVPGDVDEGDIGRDVVDRLHDPPVEGARSLGAADDEDTGAVHREVEAGARFFLGEVRGREGVLVEGSPRDDRLRGEGLVPVDVGLVGEPGEGARRLPGEGVRLEEGYARSDGASGDHARGRGVASEPEDDLGEEASRLVVSAREAAGVREDGPPPEGRAGERDVGEPRAAEDPLLDGAARAEEEDLRARGDPLEGARDGDRGTDVASGSASCEEHSHETTS